VTNSKLLTFTRYRCGKRSYVYPGDKFRVSGGPYYWGTDDQGKRVRIPMGETGVFTFRRYCELGASKWIEATSGRCATVIIYVGRKRRSRLVDGLRLGPHKIRPVYARKKRRKKPPTPVLMQKTLFDNQDT
jgi:hypothetical protein